MPGKVSVKAGFQGFIPRCSWFAGPLWGVRGCSFLGCRWYSLLLEMCPAFCQGAMNFLCCQSSFFGVWWPNCQACMDAMVKRKVKITYNRQKTCCSATYICSNRRYQGCMTSQKSEDTQGSKHLNFNLFFGAGAAAFVTTSLQFLESEWIFSEGTWVDPERHCFHEAPQATDCVI